jgi:hypothetical protein
MIRLENSAIVANGLKVVWLLYKGTSQYNLTIIARLYFYQQFPAKFDNIAATTPFLKKAVRKPKFKALVQQGLGT